jgi:hypothetical protein
LPTKASRQRALQRQIKRLDHTLARLYRISNRYTWARLLSFGGGALGSVILFFAWGWPAGVPALIAWLGGFVLIARQHNRIQASISAHTGWRSIKRAHCARMAIDWDRLPPAPSLAPRPDHPFESDLDLIGERSLLRVVDTCVSRSSSEWLRAWLTATEPDIPQVKARQALVRELTPLSLFRDKLHLHGTLGRKRRWDGDQVYAWLALHAPDPLLGTAKYLLTGVALANVILFVLYALELLPPLWLITFALYATVYLWHVQRMGDPFELGLALRDPLDDLQSVFTFLEDTRYRAHPRLETLCAPFLEGEQRPSTHIKRIARVLAAGSLRRNPPLWIVASLLVPWDLYVMDNLNRSREAVADLLPQWLDTWFEIEALSALANLAYLNPAYTFPAIDDQETDTIFETRAIGHPLIPDHACVCNDFALRENGDVVLITGSNMSGKSTFLRTLGVNLCLAYAGGPVNAAALRTTPFRLFTSIRVTDSVTNGISYFYAEVRRLKALLAALEQEHPFPLFFLIDEIFRGTNNRERLIGSRAYIRALVGQHGAGVISTHDLELVQLADEISHLENMHFEETIEDSRMAFDYKLRPGPCPTTNALKIMRMAGLPVE